MPHIFLRYQTKPQEVALTNPTQAQFFHWLSLRTSWKKILRMPWCSLIF